ncbi:MAG: GTPase HflX, partial [Blastopirellula sp. JB062]
LLLHVADASNADVVNQISAVYEVLEEIGIEEKDALLVLNKIDAVTDRHQLEMLLQRYPEALLVSAKTGEGRDKFALAVSDALSRSFRDVEVDTSIDNGKLLAYLAAHGEVVSKAYSETRMRVHCRMPAHLLGRIDDPDTVIRDYEPSDAGVDQDSIEEVA